MSTEILPGKAFTLQVFTSDECADLIRVSEEKGYGPATLSTSRNVVDEIRNHDRVIIENPELAEKLWKKIEPLLPESLRTYEDASVASSISPSFRFYRYETGARFVRHYDGYEYGSMVYDMKNNQGKLTLLIYLNEEFEGGKTTFFSQNGKEISAVKPQTGMALVYSQKLLHEGSVVKSGKKYVLRTDIIFSKPTQASQDSYCSII